MRTWMLIPVIALVAFVSIKTVVRMYDGIFGESAIEQIAAAAKSEWQSREMQDWGVRLGCQEAVGGIVSGERVKPIVERLIDCAERRLKTCGD